MPGYNVTLPIAGYAVVTVEAASERDAIAEAMNSVDMKDIESWDAYRKLDEGNVMRFSVNEASAELIEE